MPVNFIADVPLSAGPLFPAKLVSGLGVGLGCLAFLAHSMQVFYFNRILARGDQTSREGKDEGER